MTSECSECASLHQSHLFITLVVFSQINPLVDIFSILYLNLYSKKNSLCIFPFYFLYRGRYCSYPRSSRWPWQSPWWWPWQSPRWRSWGGRGPDDDGGEWRPYSWGGWHAPTPETMLCGPTPTRRAPARGCGGGQLQWHHGGQGRHGGHRHGDQRWQHIFRSGESQKLTKYVSYKNHYKFSFSLFRYVDFDILET